MPPRINKTREEKLAMEIASARANKVARAYTKKYKGSGIIVIVMETTSKKAVVATSFNLHPSMAAEACSDARKRILEKLTMEDREI